MLRKPLNRKREAPRRNEGRVQHDRIRPKASAKPSAEEKRHLGRVAGMGCLVCGAPAEAHHVHSDGAQRITRSPRRVTPLCSIHHRTGPDAVHVLSHSGFTERHGIDLLAVADQLWNER